jgi:hypothetical protein
LKAKVALEALRNEATIAELAAKVAPRRFNPERGRSCAPAGSDGGVRRSRPRSSPCAGA